MAQEIHQQKLLLSRRECTALFSVSTRFLDSLLYRGKSPFVRIGRRLLIHRKAAENFARQGTSR